MSPRRRAVISDSADSLSLLENRIGYHFHQPAWLLQALTHRSWVVQTTPPVARQGAAQAGQDNELLEFLGDAVLALRASERLLATFPAASEGQLSRLRAWIVSSRHLARMAENLNLGSFLRLSANEEKVGGRGKQRLLANALEAIIGAIQQDGGFKSAAAFVDTHVLPRLDTLQIGQLHEFAYKSALQEWAHSAGYALPRYCVIAATGPEHGKVFNVEVTLEGVYQGSGHGTTKKAAEQHAAYGALAFLKLLPGGLD